MGFGKAQKQKRNREAKLAKKRAQEQKDAELIASLDDDRNYLYNGLYLMSGKLIKELHGERKLNNFIGKHKR